MEDVYAMPLHDRTTWLHGDFFHCLQPPVALGRTWRLVLLGPPGVGKGTQANLLSAMLGACPLSTGDIFRAARERGGTHSGLMQAHDRLARGELVPDDIVLQLIHNRQTCLRCEAGFLLDGFPRTTAQASTLDGLLAMHHVRLDAVILYELDERELVARLAGRRVCSRCEAPYHVTTRPTREPGICDHCGGPVTQRVDDKPAAIRTRLAAYFEATARVADYYRQQDLLLTVSAASEPDVVLAQSLQRLASRGFPVPQVSQTV